MIPYGISWMVDQDYLGNWLKINIIKGDNWNLWIQKCGIILENKVIRKRLSEVATEQVFINYKEKNIGFTIRTFWAMVLAKRQNQREEGYIYFIFKCTY